jgi:alpha-L-fucosidase
MLYGKNFPYENFADLFNPVDLNPAEWADIFEDAGVKYIVLTTKHHEGYAMWDSNLSRLAWGRNWSAPTTGPKRDLIKVVAD